MGTYAKVDFSGPPMSCLTSVSWPLKNSGNSSVPVLKIETKSGKKCFVSAASSFSGKVPVIKLNGKFGQLLGLEDGEDVSISEMGVQVPSVKSILVHCESEDDWEILEINADTLTNKLLNQIRVIYPGLTFPFWVSKSLSINLCVDKLVPPMELGILDTFSEVMIPPVMKEASTVLELNSTPPLRCCPVSLPPGVTLTPSSHLLVSNIDYAFVYRSSLISQEEEPDVSTLKQHPSFFANIVPEDESGAGQGQGSKKVPKLKIFFLEDILEIEKELKSVFPLLNVPTLFIHPKFAEEHNLKMNSKVILETIDSSACSNIIPRYFSLPRTDCFNAEESNVFQKLFQESLIYLISALELNHKFVIGLRGSNYGWMLVTGKEGSGKTLFTRYLAQSLSNFPYFVHYEIVSCAKLRAKKSETVAKELEIAVQSAVAYSPSIVILDDLDVLCPAVRSEQQNVQEEFLLYRLCETVFECAMQLRDKQIAVICTAKSLSSLHSYWKSREGFHTFQRYVHIPPPNPLERLGIFRACLRRYQSRTENTTMSSSSIRTATTTTTTSCPTTTTTRTPPLPVSLISIMPKSSDGTTSIPLPATQLKGNNTSVEYRITESMESALSSLHDDAATPRTIHNIAKKWALALARADSEGMSGIELEQLFQDIIEQEIALKESRKEHKESKTITWDRIGGLAKVKDELTKILRWPIQYSKLFDNSPIKMPSGILLYGFPGTGKTLVGLSMSSLVPNSKFIHIKGPELLSKYIGASEQAVQDLFLKAKGLSPCILFFDEFDSLVPRRGHDSTGVTDRVVNQFLAELDGIEGGMGKGVYLIAATSRPDLIDPAVLRPGRLDKHLFFDMPGKGERLAVISALSQDLEFSGSDGEILWDEIGRKTEGFTGADLHSLLCTAQLEAIQESLGKLLNQNESADSTSENTGEVGLEEKIYITRKHMDRTMESFKPSMPVEELIKFKTIYQNFNSTRRNEMDNPSKLLLEPGKKATLA